MPVFDPFANSTAVVDPFDKERTAPATRKVVDPFQAQAATRKVVDPFQAQAATRKVVDPFAEETEETEETPPPIIPEGRAPEQMALGPTELRAPHAEKGFLAGIKTKLSGNEGPFEILPFRMGMGHVYNRELMASQERIQADSYQPYADQALEAYWGERGVPNPVAHFQQPREALVGALAKELKHQDEMFVIEDQDKAQKMNSLDWTGRLGAGMVDLVRGLTELYLAKQVPIGRGLTQKVFTKVAAKGITKIPKAAVAASVVEGARIFGTRAVIEKGFKLAAGEGLDGKDLGDIAAETGMGAAFGAVGTITKPLPRIGTQALMGYGLAKIEGATDADAATNAAIFTIFGLLNRRDLTNNYKRMGINRVREAAQKVAEDRGMPRETAQKWVDQQIDQAAKRATGEKNFDAALDKILADKKLSLAYWENLENQINGLRRERMGTGAPGAEPAGGPTAPPRPPPIPGAPAPAPAEPAGAKPATPVETPAAEPTPPTAVEMMRQRMGAASAKVGAETKVVGTGGVEFPAQYMWIPGNLVQASHDPATFNRNPEYPLANTRDYANKAEQEKVLRAATQWDPEQAVTDSPSAAVGPSMVAKVTDEVGNQKYAVLGGNGREMAQKLMLPEKRAAQAALEAAKAQQFGLPAPDQAGMKLYRYLGEFDLRVPGTREKLQKMVDSLNPSPGKVQNLGEMATVDAEQNLGLDELGKVDMGVTARGAQDWVARQIALGKLDANLRAQVAEDPVQAAQYVRMALAHAAYRQPVLTEFVNTAATQTQVGRNMVELSVPALLEMRRKGLGPVADAFAKGMTGVAQDYAQKGNLVQALNLAADQMDMDPRMRPVNDVAAALRDMLVRRADGGVKPTETVQNFQMFWDAMRHSLAKYDASPDMFGTQVSPEDAVRAAIRFARKQLAMPAAAPQPAPVEAPNPPAAPPAGAATPAPPGPAQGPAGAPMLTPEERASIVRKALPDYDPSRPLRTIEQAEQLRSKIGEMKAKIRTASGSARSAYIGILGDSQRALDAIQENQSLAQENASRPFKIGDKVWTTNNEVTSTSMNPTDAERASKPMTVVKVNPKTLRVRSESGTEFVVYRSATVPEGYTAAVPGPAQGPTGAPVEGAKQKGAGISPGSQTVETDLRPISGAKSSAFQSTPPFGGDKVNEPQSPYQVKGKSEENDSSFSELPPENLVPKHEIRDLKKLTTLTKDMERNGWDGRPIVAIDDLAITATHRIKAAQKAKLDTVPVVSIPFKSISDALGRYVDAEYAKTKKGVYVPDMFNSVDMFVKEDTDNQIRWLNKIRPDADSSFDRIIRLLEIENRNDDNPSKDIRYDTPAIFETKAKPSTASSDSDNIVREPATPYQAALKEYRKLLQKRDDTGLSQVEVKRMEAAELTLGQKFMDFMEIEKTIIPLANEYIEKHSIQQQDRQQLTFDLFREVQNELFQEHRSFEQPVLPGFGGDVQSELPGLAGGDTGRAGVRGPEGAGEPAPSMGTRVEGDAGGLRAGVPGGKPNPAAAWLTDPQAFGPQIAAHLENAGRISTVIADLVSDRIPAFQISEGATIQNAHDWRALNMQLRTPLQESTRVAVTDVNGRILLARMTSLGTLDRADLVARDIKAVWEQAKRYGTPHKIWGAHNHPSGDATPSEEDVLAYRALEADLGAARVADMLVTDGGQFYSYRENGMVQPAQEHVAAWEAVPASRRLRVTTPNEARALVAAIATPYHPEALYMLQLNSRNRLVAVDLNTTVEQLQHNALTEGIAAVVLGVNVRGRAPTEAEVLKGKRLKADLEKAGIRLMDVVHADGFSWRERGSMDWTRNTGSLPAQPEPATVLRERPEPYAAAGAPEKDTPYALEVNRGKLKTPEWIKVRLGAPEFIRPMEMPEIYNLAKHMGATIQLKKMRGGKRGTFQGRGPGSARIQLDYRIFQDARIAQAVFSHEIGHFDDWLPDYNLSRGNLVGRVYSLKRHMRDTYGDSLVTNTQLREELLALSAWWRPWDESKASQTFKAYRRSAVELYADAISVLYNAPQELQARAPKFFAEFFRGLDKKPPVKADLFELWDRLNRPYMRLMEDRRKQYFEMVGRGDQALIEKAEERRLQHESLRGRLDLFRQQYIDIYDPVVRKARAAKAAGAVIPWDRDPEMVFDESALSQNQNYLYMQWLLERVILPMREIAINEQHIGEILFHNRILNERYVALNAAGEPEMSGRAYMANPNGTTPEVARKQLMAVRLGFETAAAANGESDPGGLKTWTAVQRAIQAWRDINFGIMEAAYKQGLFTAEQFEQVRRNRDNYATFASLDHVMKGDSIPGGIKHQYGNLDHIVDPFVATVIKTNVLLKWMQHERASSVTVDFLLKHDPDTIHQLEPNEMRWTGRRLEPNDPPQGKGMISRMRNGKQEYFYVDPLIAEMFKGVLPGQFDMGAWTLKHAFGRIIYPLWITYNYTFGYFTNPARDFLKTVRNLHAMGHKGPTALKLAKAYIETWNAAVAKVRGETNPLVAEMLDNFAMPSPLENFNLYQSSAGNPLENFNLYRGRDASYMDRLMADYHLQPETAGSFTKFISSKPAGRGVLKLAQLMAFGGAVGETISKTAGYQVMRHDMGLAPQEAALKTRWHVGTPPWYRKGKNATLHGSLIPFWNIFLRSWESELRLMTKPGTRGAWWLHWAMTSGLLTVIKALGAVGAFGLAIKAVYDGQSDHTKTNKHVIPLGVMPSIPGEFGEDDEPGKSVVLPIPMPETDRFINGVLYKVIVGLAGDQNQAIWDKWGNLLSQMGADVPGINPFATVGAAWGQYMSNQNPMDFSRGSPVLTSREHLMRGWEGTSAMLHWSAEEMGMLNLLRYNRNSESTLETTIGVIPILNSLIKFDDAGYREIERTKKRFEAQQRVLEKIRDQDNQPPGGF
jgi:hypothetical protein